MPFEVQQINNHGTEIYLMRYDNFESNEHLDKLTDSEIERYMSFKAEKRRQEFVATRILRHKLFGYEHIHYDNQGAPFIEQEGFISISHSKDLIGIAINKAYKLGLDLESYRENIHHVSHKFLSDRELKNLDCKNAETLCKIWSAKEAMYKLAGRKKIHFKSELVVLDDPDGFWIGLIDNHDHVLKVKLDIFEYHDTFITINTEEVIKEQHYDITSN